MKPLACMLALLLAPACDTTGSIDGAGDGDGDGDGDVDDSDPCLQRVAVESGTAEPADLLLVVDKSGSMEERLETGDEKWPIMESALDTVVSEYDDGIRFGLQLFPADDECRAGDVVADIGAAQGSSITSSLAVTDPEGGTPTHTTLAAARTYYGGIPENPAGRYVLLATDGEPNCGDPNDTQEPTVDESIAAIDSLAADGIPTFVLGFGGDVNTHPDTLEGMAAAGGMGDYFAANNPDQLSIALAAIASELGVISCTIRLKSTPEYPDLIEVSQDGSSIPEDPAEGWTYDEGTNSITFHGSSCDSLKDGAVAEIAIGLGCGAPPVD
jgi:hypothetical protein